MPHALHVLGGVAVVCPECSFVWTVAPAVRISWFCPRCGGARTERTDHYRCVCGHPYCEHNTRYVMPPSRHAFGINIRELDQLGKILATEPEPLPRLGNCGACDCGHFRLEPPFLSAETFMNDVSQAAQRGAGGRTIEVINGADGTLCLGQGTRSIFMRARHDGGVAVDADARVLAPRTLRMGNDTVGATVIAIRGALGESVTLG